MQDRTYAVAIAAILAICCLGVYVAVSGFLNSKPPSLASSSTGPGTPATLVIVVVNTITPAPAKASATFPLVLTSAPVPSPLGAFQTITAATTVMVTRTVTPTVTPKPPAPPTAVPPPAVQSCVGFAFCPRGGFPDASLAPAGECPRNYIWGIVLDLNGKGIPGRQIRWKGPLDASKTETSKGLPDPPGTYNIFTSNPGDSWTLWLLDASGGQASPQITITTQAYSGSGNCPNRVDFVQQR